MNFEPVYMLMIEKHNGDRVFGMVPKPEGGEKLIIAQEGNQKYLEYIGGKLLDDELISGYQMIKTVTPPIRSSYEIQEFARLTQQMQPKKRSLWRRIHDALFTGYRS